MDHSDCDLRFLSDGTVWCWTCDQVVDERQLRSYQYDAVEITESAGDWRPPARDLFSDA